MQKLVVARGSSAAATAARPLYQDEVIGEGRLMPVTAAPRTSVLYQKVPAAVFSSAPMVWW